MLSRGIIWWHGNLLALSCALSLSVALDEHMTNALKLMSETPLIDGHNDLPWQIRMKFNNQLKEVDLYTLNSTHTNLHKIREGRLAAQFWAAYVPCGSQYKDAVRQTLEQIDVIHRMCKKYPEDLMFASSSQDIIDAFNQNKTASLIGVEGGHSLDSSLSSLRTMYQLGVRYLTLTHSCNTPWGDNWLVDTGAPSQHNGLSEFGKQLILEMNRIGMLIDLAHVSEKVMNQVLDLSKAPVIFSHSSAFAICPRKRNVPDDVLLKVKEKKGIVMVNFYNNYVTCDTVANLSQVADHFDHIRKVAGYSIIGFGGDYDGVNRSLLRYELPLPDNFDLSRDFPKRVNSELLRKVLKYWYSCTVPEGLEDVSKYPALVAELLRRGWSNVEVKAALGENLLRVFRAVEKMRDSLNNTLPDDVPIPYEDVVNDCRTSYGYQVSDSTSSVCFLSSLALTLSITSLLLWAV